MARAEFDKVLGDRPNQIARQRDDVYVTADDLLTLPGSVGAVTLNGVRTNIRIVIRYLGEWLSGTAIVAIDDHLEDTAMAEVCRAQLWQWRVTGTVLDDGAVFDADRYRTIRDDVLASLPRKSAGDRVDEAVALLDRLVLDDAFAEFLTLDAYRMLD